MRELLPPRIFFACPLRIAPLYFARRRAASAFVPPAQRCGCHEWSQAQARRGEASCAVLGPVGVLIGALVPGTSKGGSASERVHQLCHELGGAGCFAFTEAIISTTSIAPQNPTFSTPWKPFLSDTAFLVHRPRNANRGC